MKRVLITLTMLLLLTVTLVVASACGTSDTTTAEATTTEVITTAPITEVKIPDGYKEYKNTDISFAYPEDWTKTSGSTTTLSDTETGNNITIVYEDKNPFYATMDLDDYNEQLKPMLESAGMSVSNASVEQTKNASGLAITKIAHKVSLSGVSMKQTMYIVTSGNKTYTVTVTEVTNDAKLLSTVFETLKTLK
ncbi:MAG: hypothetical protein IKC63_03670 [Clostridia bacterium]|nr:hypothetical protein [Clostridia bacterium]